MCIYLTYNCSELHFWISEKIRPSPYELLNFQHFCLSIKENVWFAIWSEKEMIQQPEAAKGKRLPKFLPYDFEFFLTCI